MVYDRNKVWRSDLAQELLRTEGGDDIKEAALRLVDKKLSAMQSYKQKLPIDLKLIASIMGIDPTISAVVMTESGRIIPRDGKYYIEVNQAHSPQRRRFSAAHEIGHKMLAGKKLAGVKTRSVSEKDIEEQEEEDICDLIAGFLLGLRPDILVPFLFDRGFSFDTIQFVGKKLDVSFEATARALIQYFEGEAAVLYCIPSSPSFEDDIPRFVIHHYYITQSFPSSFLRGQLIPKMYSVSRAYLSKTLVKLSEACSFDGQVPITYICQVKKMPVYVDGRSETGLVIVLLPLATTPTKE